MLEFLDLSQLSIIHVYVVLYNQLDTGISVPITTKYYAYICSFS